MRRDTALLSSLTSADQTHTTPTGMYKTVFQVRDKSFNPHNSTGPKGSVILTTYSQTRDPSSLIEIQKQSLCFYVALYFVGEKTNLPLNLYLFHGLQIRLFQGPTLSCPRFPEQVDSPLDGAHEGVSSHGWSIYQPVRPSTLPRWTTSQPVLHLVLSLKSLSSLPLLTFLLYQMPPPPLLPLVGMSQ